MCEPSLDHLHKLLKSRVFTLLVLPYQRPINNRRYKGRERFHFQLVNSSSLVFSATDRVSDKEIRRALARSRNSKGICTVVCAYRIPFLSINELTEYLLHCMCNIGTHHTIIAFYTYKCLSVQTGRNPSQYIAMHYNVSHVMRLHRGFDLFMRSQGE